MFKLRTQYYCPCCKKGVNKLFVTKDKYSPYPLYIHSTCRNVVTSIKKNVVPITN